METIDVLENFKRLTDRMELVNKRMNALHKLAKLIGKLEVDHELVRFEVSGSVFSTEDLMLEDGVICLVNPRLLTLLKDQQKKLKGELIELLKFESLEK